MAKGDSEYIDDRVGGYSGGGFADIASDWFRGVGAMSSPAFFGLGPTGHFVWGVIVVCILLFIAIGTLGFAGFGIAKVAGMTDYSSGRLGFAASRADGYGEPSESGPRVIGGMDGFTSRAQDAYSTLHRSSGFMNSRETPYYSDVPNSTLMTEDREREAVRALAKINQERLRRAAADPNAPMAWDPFWKEWETSHPLDSDGEGFNNPMKPDGSNLVPY